MRKILRIIILILIIMLAIIALFFLSSDGQTYLIVNYINNDKKINSGTETVGNISEVFSLYEGDMNSIVLDKSAYNFAVNLIPEYYKIQDVTEYYNQNKKIIERYIGITNFDDFYKLVEKIKKLNGNNLKLEKYMIYEKSTTKNIDTITTVLAIQYENNDKILFKLEILNNIEKNKVPIKYNAEVDDKYNTSRDESVIDSEIHTEKSPGKIIN